jgi:hypothetical protein
VCQTSLRRLGSKATPSVTANAFGWRDVPAPADLGVALAADRCDTATRAAGHRFVVMPQVSWQTMMSEFPAAAHVVTGLLPSEDAASGLGRVRGFLLGRLARALPVSGLYAIAEIVERDGTHVQCALASASDAAELAEAVGANDSGCYSRWASRRSSIR